MGGEAGSERGEPKFLVGGMGAKAFFEGEENRGAGHVAMAAEDFAGFCEMKIRECGFDGFDDIAPTGVGKDLFWVSGAAGEEGGDCICCKARDGAVELVFEFPVRVGETDFFPLGGDVVGIERVKFQKVVCVLLAAENGSGGAVSEKAEGDQDTWIVIDVKSGGGDFHRDHGDAMGRICSEVAVCAAEGRDGGTAAEADEIAEVGIRSKAKFFRDVTGRSGAEVAGAGAEKKCVNVFSDEPGLYDGFFQSIRREIWSVVLEGMVELLSIHFKNRLEIRSSELPGLDTRAVVSENFLQKAPSARFYRSNLWMRLECPPGVGLGEGMAGVGGGDAVEIHEKC